MAYAFDFLAVDVVEALDRFPGVGGFGSVGFENHVGFSIANPQG